MTEKGLWKRIRETMMGVRGWAGVRIEAGAGEAMAGTPDCVITASGRTRWVELKVWPEPLNRWQLVWCTMRDSTGADGVLVLAGVRDGVALMRWRQYHQGEITSGWHGTIDQLSEAFESPTWHFMEKIRPQKRGWRKRRGG